MAGVRFLRVASPLLASAALFCAVAVTTSLSNQAPALRGDPSGHGPSATSTNVGRSSVQGEAVGKLSIPSATAAPGDLVTLSFPAGNIHGSAYVLLREVRGRSVPKYVLFTEGSPGGLGAVRWLPRRPIIVPDIGLLGRTDRVRVPRRAAPGRYRLCGYPGESSCGHVRVREP